MPDFLDSLIAFLFRLRSDSFAMANVFVILLALTTEAQENLSIPVQSAYLRLDADVSIPAKEAGVLKAIQVKVGDSVQVGELLAQIDDEAAALLARKAELELQIATAKASSTTQSKLCQEELKVAEAKYARGKDSKDRFDSSLSATELEKLKLDVTTSQLKLEDAQLERSNASKQELLSRNALEVANSLVKRHKIFSSLDGMVTEILRDPGEWVKPGESVVRVIGLNKLKVIGFIDAKAASDGLIGSSVSVVSDKGNGQQVTRRGVLEYVSPEIDAVNGTVKVIASVPNQDRALNPGVRVKMTISPTNRSLRSK